MKRVKNSIEITNDHRAELKRARDETGCGASAFLRWAEGAPDSLSGMTIEHWMQGRIKTANAELLAFVLENWPKMPKKVPVTDKLVGALKAEQSRTGLMPKRLLATMDAVPEGLSANSVSMWMGKRVKQAKQEHVDAVLNAYARIPSDKS